MSSTELPESGRDGRDGEPATALERLTGACAVFGGLLTLAVALLATVSVLLRWLISSPIDGDFEYVKMATAVAVFSYLPYTQARRGNIMVDTFTMWLPKRVVNIMDAFWDLVFAAVMAYLTYCLINGTLGVFHSGETTMQRQLLIWPSIALCTALAALVSVTALGTGLRLLGMTNGRSSP
ncbi:MAG TPA: TRAP transporter small permease [Hyphomicrobiaceae bacterium]|nr:TRAP transporter small permease [Hyphomicrobiaceae bacterium]